MKKIFYILTAAIVALGTMACENEGFDNLNPEIKGEGLYLTAEISRTGLENNMTTWTDGDVVTITFDGTTFNFKHQGGGVFFSDDEGVFSLKGQSGLTAWYNYEGIDSSAGVAGARLSAEGGSFDADGNASGFNFVVQNGFVKVEIMNDFKDPFVLTTSEAIFSTGNSVEIQGKGVHYVAINPNANQLTLSATIGGVEMKNGKVTFSGKKVYNIGQLNAEVSNFTVFGQHQGWNKDTAEALYKIPGSNTYARKGVELKNDTADDKNSGFKFYCPGVTVNADASNYIFLKPNSNWTSSGAWFAVHTWETGQNGVWYAMSKALNGNYYVDKSKVKTNLLFARMASGSTESNMNWNDGKVWNQTSDLTKQATNNLYTINNGVWSKGAGSWSKLATVSGSTGAIYIGKDKETITNWVTRWTNNGGGNNIQVSDYTKTYDLYISEGGHQIWGFEVYYTVKEHGAAAPTLK